MLHRLSQKQLAKTIFPLGNFSKEEVREIAEEFQFPIFKKKDSQDLCFLDKDGVTGFFQRQAGDKMKKGEVVNIKGEILGEHKGLMAYTIGQRKGLGIAAPRPLFVIKKDHQNNRLIVGFTEERKKKFFFVEDFHFIDGNIPKKQISVSTKIRYQGQEKTSYLRFLKQNLQVEFMEAVEDISPGQGAVFYQGDRLLGGGIIS